MLCLMGRNRSGCFRFVCAFLALILNFLKVSELDLNLEYKPDVREDLEAVGKKLEECTERCSCKCPREKLISYYAGYLKSCDSFIDLVNVLKHEIQDGQLSFRGKRVLKLGCSYGLRGIFACLNVFKSPSTHHTSGFAALLSKAPALHSWFSRYQSYRIRRRSHYCFWKDSEEAPHKLLFLDFYYA